MPHNIAIAACTHLIVCIQTHMFSYSGMTRLLDTAVAVMDAYESNIESFALPTLHERNSNSHQVILKQDPGTLRFELFLSHSQERPLH